MRRSRYGERPVEVPERLLDPTPYPLAHTAACTAPRAVAMPGVLPDLVYVRCRTCADWTFHLAERYRVNTRLSFEDVEPVTPGEVSFDRAPSLDVPRRPNVADGRVRNGRRRAA